MHNVLIMSQAYTVALLGSQGFRYYLFCFYFRFALILLGFKGIFSCYTARSFCLEFVFDLPCIVAYLLFIDSLEIHYENRKFRRG